jgi:Uma2 family endonuclease
MKIITDINELDLEGSYTYADYLTWQFKDRLELFRGKIFKMSPAPNRLHQSISRNLNGTFWEFFKGNTCSFYDAPFDVRLVKTKKNDKKVVTVVQPDLCVVCNKSKLDDRGCEGAPDLVVEIVSPGNTKKEMGIKFELYEENEVKEYWIVEPANKTIFLYTLKNGVFIGLKPLTEDDVMKSPLFPNLKFEVKMIFED